MKFSDRNHIKNGGHNALFKAFVLLMFYMGVTSVSYAQLDSEGHMPLNDSLKALIGKEIPDFTLPDMEWNEVQLSSLENKVILVDFWASWCRYCRGFNQEISDLYFEYNKEGFEIVSVSFDTDYYKWKKASQTDDIKWINVNEREGMDSETAKNFFIDHTPTTFLLDKDKKVVAIDLEGEALEEKIKELLK